MPQATFPTSTVKIIYQNIAGWGKGETTQTHRAHFAKHNSDILVLTDTGVFNLDRNFKDDKERKEHTIKFHPYICYQYNTED